MHFVLAINILFQMCSIREHASFCSLFCSTSLSRTIYGAELNLLRQKEESSDQVRVVRCSQTSNRVPARHSSKARGATTLVATDMNVGERLLERVRIDAGVNETDRLLADGKTSVIDHGQNRGEHWGRG